MNGLLLVLFIAQSTTQAEPCDDDDGFSGTDDYCIPSIHPEIIGIPSLARQDASIIGTDLRVCVIQRL